MGGQRGVGPKAPRYEPFKPSSSRASDIARRIGRKDTKAEVLLRKALWALGLRYRKNVATLPGKPDIVFTRARVAVFVDGDFWHGRNWEERLAKLQKGANAPYWVAKIAANMERDRRKTAELEAAGWTVIRVWETDVLHDLAAQSSRIRTRTQMSPRIPSLLPRTERGRRRQSGPHAAGTSRASDCTRQRVPRRQVATRKAPTRALSLPTRVRRASRT